MTIYAKDSGSWRTITASNPGSLSVKDGGVWRTITESYIQDASTWRFVYGANYELWGWGSDAYFGLFSQSPQGSGSKSSPVQIPGTTWNRISTSARHVLATKTDNTLWAWGDNANGQLGQNNTTSYQSPRQIPGTTWNKISVGDNHSIATKTDNTLWTWGRNVEGALGQNNFTSYSSPIQIPGNSWNNVAGGSRRSFFTKTDGTLWACGFNNAGELGINFASGDRNSPTQIPGNTWSSVSAGYRHSLSTKTDGTLWAWGSGGGLGQNNRTYYSSPVQIPGNTWRYGSAVGYDHSLATKTDNTLWAWGDNANGQLGQNNRTTYLSPVQIPGTTWSSIPDGNPAFSPTPNSSLATKTDGTLWSWGYNGRGQLGQNNRTQYSSPVQIPGTTWATGDIKISTGGHTVFAIKNNVQ